MSIHGYSFAEYADEFSKYISKIGSTYLDFRDVPDLLRKYAKGNVALDYGCGSGRSAAFLRKLGFLVDGVDINENMMILAQQAMPSNNFRALHESKIVAKNEHYDLVFCSFVLPEIDSKRKLISTLSEIARVLKQGGIFLAIVLSEALYGKDWFHANAEFEENKNLKSGDRAKVLMKESNFYFHDYFWTERDYREVLQEAGLDVIVVHRPLGRGDDGFAWINEKEIAPFTIYVAEKKTTDIVYEVNKVLK